MGPHGRKINTCAKGGIGCKRSRSRRQWKHAEERGTRKKTEKRKEKKKKKKKKKRQQRAIVRAERLTTHRNHVSVEQRDQGGAARPSPRERRQGALPRSGNAVEATVSPRCVCVLGENPVIVKNRVAVIKVMELATS